MILGLEGHVVSRKWQEKKMSIVFLIRRDLSPRHSLVPLRHSPVPPAASAAFLCYRARPAGRNHVSPPLGKPNWRQVFQRSRRRENSTKIPSDKSIPKSMLPEDLCANK